MKKLILTLFVFTAIIRSTYVSERHGRFGYWTGLCANYDILQNGKAVDSNSTCGQNWKEIDDSIRYQLQKRERVEEEKQEADHKLQHLRDIKNDEIGKVIR